MDGTKTLLDLLSGNAALATAIAGILLTIFSYRQQRHHHRTMVIPYGRLVATDNTFEGQISLANNGIGPLIVSDFQLFYAGSRKPISADQMRDDLLALLATGIGSHPITWHWRIGTIEKNTAIPASESHSVVWVEIAAKEEEPTDQTLAIMRDVERQVKKFLAGFTIVCRYTDAYGSKKWVERFDGASSYFAAYGTPAEPARSESELRQALSVPREDGRPTMRRLDPTLRP